MGAKGAPGWPNQRPHTPVSINDLSPHHHGLPTLNIPTLNMPNIPKPVSPGQRTLPISGAPRVPANPLLAMFLRAHGK